MRIILIKSEIDGGINVPFAFRDRIIRLQYVFYRTSIFPNKITTYKNCLNLVIIIIVTVIEHFPDSIVEETDIGMHQNKNDVITISIWQNQWIGPIHQAVQYFPDNFRLFGNYTGDVRGKIGKSIAFVT